MDSIHLSETQNTPLNFKSTACNTSPCGYGLEDYGQTITPAYCLRTLHPEISKCKHFQEKPEEKFFPNLPLFYPLFPSGEIPTSVCCSHNPLNEASSAEEKKPTNEHEKIPQPPLPDDYMSCQKGSYECQVNKPPLEEEVQKNSMLGPEKQFLGYPFLYQNLPESQVNSLFHRCPCGVSIPWTCSSLMVPMISYCIFWNSQRANMNLPPPNYISSSHEAMPQRNSENSVNKKESCSNENESLTRMKVVDEINNNSIEVERNHGGGDFKSNKSIKLDDEKEYQENIDENRIKSSSLLTFDSTNCNEGISIEPMEENNTYSKSNLGKIEEDEYVDANQIDRLKLKEKDSNTSLPNDSLRGDESPLSERSRPQSPLEAGKSMTLQSEAQGNFSILTTVVENSSDASISSSQENDSDGESKKNKFMTKATKPHSIKKFIKTFTLIDQTSSALQDGMGMVPDAGAGDVGGSNCLGYKVNISSLEGDDQVKIRQETQTEENLDSKESFLKDELDLEENKRKIFLEKNSEENPKGRQSFKSGIAKLRNGAKSKGSKSDEEQIIKNYKKETSEKVHTKVNRKHCCFPNVTTAGVSEKSSKILKIRNCTVVQHQTQGPEKQPKPKHGFFKKEENTSKVKVQSTDSQKLAKYSGKK